MKAYFELQDKGTCRNFTIIRGVKRTYTFVKDPVARQSRYNYEGNREGFDAIMRDIYGELLFSKQRNTAILVFPEIPEPVDTSVLESDNKELHLALGEANEKIAALEALLAEAYAGKKKAPKKSAFPPADFIPPVNQDGCTILPDALHVDGGTRLPEPTVDGPALAAGSASLNPDEETKTPPPATLTPQEKRKATIAAKKAAAAQNAPPPKSKPKGKAPGKGKKKSSRHAA